MNCPPNHIEHPNEIVANNFAKAHKWKNPRCSGLVVFACGDHFHTGHKSLKYKLRCINRNKEYNGRGWKEDD